LDTLYAFRFQGETLLLRAASDVRAQCRAFHEVVETYDLDPDRLDELGWPADQDYSALDVSDGPIVLEGG